MAIKRAKKQQLREMFPFSIWTMSITLMMDGYHLSLFLPNNKPAALSSRTLENVQGGMALKSTKSWFCRLREEFSNGFLLPFNSMHHQQNFLAWKKTLYTLGSSWRDLGNLSQQSWNLAESSHAHLKRLGIYRKLILRVALVICALSWSLTFTFLLLWQFSNPLALLKEVIQEKW